MPPVATKYACWRVDQVAAVLGVRSHNSTLGDPAAIRVGTNEDRVPTAERGQRNYTMTPVIVSLLILLCLTVCFSNLLVSPKLRQQLLWQDR